MFWTAMTEKFNIEHLETKCYQESLYIVTVWLEIHTAEIMELFRQIETVRHPNFGSWNFVVVTQRIHFLLVYICFTVVCGYIFRISYHFFDSFIKPKHALPQKVRNKKTHSGEHFMSGWFLVNQWGINYLFCHCTFSITSYKPKLGWNFSFMTNQ